MSEKNNNQDEEFLNLIANSFSNPNENAIAVLWDFLKEVDGIGIFPKGIEAIKNIIGYSKNFTKKDLEEKINKIHQARFIDTLAILIASDREIKVSKNFIEDIEYDRNSLCSKLTNEQCNKYQTYQQLLNKYDLMESFYSNKDCNCNKSENNDYDFSNLPISKFDSNDFNIHEEQLKEIKNIFDIKTYCIVKGEGGIGKTTLIRSFVEDKENLKNFEKGYAWSFYNQGEPNNQQNLIEEKQIYLNIIRFFLDDNFFENENLRNIFKYLYTQKNGKILYKDKEITTQNINDIVLEAYNNKSSDRVLFNILLYIFKGKNLLILDGMEILQQKLSTNDNQPLKLLFDALNDNNSQTKVLISTRTNSIISNSDNAKELKLEPLKTENVKEILENHLKNVNEDKIANISKLIVDNNLNTPLYIRHIIRYLEAKKSEANSTYIDEFLELDIFSKNRQEYSIFSEIMRKATDTFTSKKEIINFMYIASSLYKPLSDTLYEKISQKLSSLKLKLSPHNEIKDKLENNELAFFDERDKDKPYTDTGTYDIHPIIKTIFKKWLSQNEKLYSQIHSTYGELFLELYENALKHNKDNLNNLLYEEKHFIIDALHYYNKAKNFGEVVDILNKYVNNKEPIKNFALHTEIFNELEILFKNAQKTKIPHPLNKLYMFLSFTLGYASKSVKFGFDKLDSINFDTYNERNYDFIADNSSDLNDKEEKKLIELYDWRINLLEAIKYSGQIDKIESLKEFKSRESNRPNTIVVFWKCLYTKRFEEIEIMTKCKIINNLDNIDINEVLKEEYIKNDLSKEEKGNYSLHPHIIWCDRLIGLILDAWINHNKIYDATIQKIENILKRYIEIYKSTNRTAYLTIAYINLAKIYYIKMQKNKHSQNGKYYLSAFNKYNDNCNIALEYAQSSGKIDFLIEVYLFRVFSKFMIDKDYKDDYNILSRLVENSDIDFYKAEYAILKSAIDKNCVCEKLKGKITNWCYLKGRLELLCPKCKNSD
jgi:hypothetical protein